MRTALATGCVDYFRVQAWEQEKYVQLGRQYGREYFTVQDQEAIGYPDGYRQDPLWQDPILKDSDPVVGEEFWETPRVNATLAPGEYDLVAVRSYAAGAAGIFIVNNDYAYQLGALADSRETLRRMESGSVFGQRDGHEIIM